MSKTVYLVGHGRLSIDPRVKPCQITEKFTIHWLVPMGDVADGLSRAFLDGSMRTPDSTSIAGAAVPEHYLCGEMSDACFIADRKLTDFFQRATPHPNGDPDPMFIVPRGKTNVSLTSIMKFLTMLSPTTDWSVYWTCCRGYIDTQNFYKTLWDKSLPTPAVGRIYRGDDAPKSPKLTADRHVTVEASFASLIIIAKSDVRLLGREAQPSTVAAKLLFPGQPADPPNGGKPKPPAWL